MAEPILIDGSEGEGGGQMLRSALALSLLTQQPFRLFNIRANRPKPGLAAQHLASVQAAATIGNATVRGDKLGSRDVTFEPGEVRSGDYDFRIGTAGATALVLHTVYLPLLLRGQGPSTVRITGGTHVKAAPTFEYLRVIWSGYLNWLGPKGELTMSYPGFFPRGGGRIEVSLRHAGHLKGADLAKRNGTGWPLPHVAAMSRVAGLPRSIAQRQVDRVAERLAMFTDADKLRYGWNIDEWSGGPGTTLGLFLLASEKGPALAGFTALGERSKPAEAVADEAVDALLAHWQTAPTAVDPHAADQLLLPLVFAEGASRVQTSEVTQHLLTNAETIGRFVPRPIKIDGRLGGPGWVEIPA